LLPQPLCTLAAPWHSVLTRHPTTDTARKGLVGQAGKRLGLMLNYYNPKLVMPTWAKYVTYSVQIENYRFVELAKR
jgi:hypothetical protein